jgi:hypothetical protein
MDIEYHIEGLDSLLIEVRAEGEEVKERIQEAMREAATAGEIAMQLGVPVDSGDLFDSIEISPLTFEPGGGGGGGFYRIAVRAGEGQEEKVSWVTEGTRGPIYPKHSKALKIQKEGEPVQYRAWVSGQEPQTDWIFEGHAAASEILSARLRDI